MLLKTELNATNLLSAFDYNTQGCPKCTLTPNRLQYMVNLERQFESQVRQVDLGEISSLLSGSDLMSVRAIKDYISLTFAHLLYMAGTLVDSKLP